jgi:hypothetical protein
MAASHKFETPEDPYDFWQGIRPLLSDAVGVEIGYNIKKWSTELTENVPSEGTRNYTEFIKAISVVPIKEINEYFKEEKGLLDPSYHELLENKDYKQLLDLSFYDVDFGTPPTTYTFQFGEIERTITEPNLKTALDGNFISKTDLGSETAITLKPEYDKTTSYWTTEANLKNNVIITPKIS